MKRSHVTSWLGVVGLALAASACGGGDGAAGGVEFTYVAGLGSRAAGAQATESAAPPSATSLPGTADGSLPTDDRTATDGQPTTGGQPTTEGSVPVVVRVTVPDTDPPVTTEPDDGFNPFGGDSPEDRLMPSVVCMNLQDAQNEIQDHGVFFSRSEDATGEGRRQMWDRNWQVVAQTPEPGEPIGEGDAVLYVVKYDDDHPNPC